MPGHFGGGGKIPYPILKRDHEREYRRLFDRVDFRLGGTDEDPALSRLPTDQRLARLKSGQKDPALETLYFQFGRYLLISSSRPGCLPANLQGIWNGEMLPPWDSKYTININAEMNYWPAEVCNLSECHLPLFDLIERMRPNGRRTAREMYGCHGFVAHHNTDIWGDTAPQDLYTPATQWPMGAAWLCLHIWEHYLYTEDKKFLESRYDALREASEFFTEFLVADARGHMVTCPSVSPENTYALPDGQTGHICAGPSMDCQIIYKLFHDCINAAAVLGKDEAYCAGLSRLLEKLPRPQIGKHGQLMEWQEDYDEPEPGHRHISQLFALFPSDQISLRETPELAAAARKTLERRLAHGGGHTGWSRAWIVNMWARLGDGEEAYRNIQALMANSTLPNLLDTHPPFQIDGNLGGLSGMAEMLLQSHSDEIRLLPALPTAWPQGNVQGLCARNGFEVGMTWADGRLTSAHILSKLGRRCTLRAAVPFTVTCDGGQTPVRAGDNGTAADFETTAGKTYTLQFD